MSHKFVVFWGWVYLDGLLGFSPKAFSKERSCPNLSAYIHLFMGCAFLFHSQPLVALVQPGCCLSSRYETGEGWQTQSDDKPVVLKSCSALETGGILQIHSDLLSFHLLFLLLLSDIFLFCLFLPGVAPHLLFISKLKCLQVTLLLTSSETKPKCHSGCQVLLHKPMVHPKSESSWVIEHYSAAAVEHGASYLKKTPMLVITDLVLITHHLLVLLFWNTQKVLMQNETHSEKILQKDFAGPFGSLGNLQNH